MHDCRKTKKILVDLVFAELETWQQQQALADVRSCPACSEEYQSMLATLRVFDQTADALMPEESYWTGYQAKLRTRLAKPVAPNRRERLAALFAGQVEWLLAKPAIPVAIAAGLILIAAISIFLFSPRNVSNPQVVAVKPTSLPSPAPKVGTPEQPGSPQNEVPVKLQSVAVKSRQPRQPRRDVKPPVFAQNDLTAANLMLQGTTQLLSPAGLPVVAPASHLEKAQLLLRSFRNVRTEGKDNAIDLAYEKRQAGKLVYDNILLRREAEAKGHLPVEEALNSLEPLLLDIANLSDKPSRSEVQMIRERIHKQEIIAMLQIVSSGTERFSSPTLLNP